jgi:hypothetical protein
MAVSFIKRGADQKEIEKAFESLKSGKTFNSLKHCGVLRLKEDALQIQQRLRNEWQ